MKNITVNGKPVEQYLNEEKEQEIQEFYRFELRMSRRGTQRHIISTNTSRVSRPVYKADGSVEVR